MDNERFYLTEESFARCLADISGSSYINVSIPNTVRPHTNEEWTNYFLSPNLIRTEFGSRLTINGCSYYILYAIMQNKYNDITLATIFSQEKIYQIDIIFAYYKMSKFNINSISSLEDLSYDGCILSEKRVSETVSWLCKNNNSEIFYIYIDIMVKLGRINSTNKDIVFYTLQKYEKTEYIALFLDYFKNDTSSGDSLIL